MNEGLSSKTRAFYEENGYLAPIPVLSEAEAIEVRRKLESLEIRHPEAVPKLDMKATLLAPWLDEVSRRTAFLDVVQSLFGADILLWNSGFRTKERDSPAFADWHQDGMYIKVEPVVHFWVAFSPATARSGCLRVIPGSHRLDVFPHEDTSGTESFLTRGQRITVDVDESGAIEVELAPGEAMIFHSNLIHSSRPNQSDDRRIAFIPSYCPTWAVNHGPRDSAMLVRGVDTHHHFDPDPRPDAEMSPVAVAVHHRATVGSSQTMYRGSERTPLALT
jgi:hypothetical protein